MYDITKHFMINDKIQKMLFELQIKSCGESEGCIIRKAIVLLYKKEKE